MSEGWIKLHRKIEKHWIWNKSEYLKAWIHILIRCNHDDNKVLVGKSLIEVNRGSFITSIGNFSREINMSPQEVRTFFSLLITDKMINKESTRKLTKISVINYDTYQTLQQTNNKQLTNKQQTANKQLTTDKNDKELIKKDTPNFGNLKPEYISLSLRYHRKRKQQGLKHKDFKTELSENSDVVLNGADAIRKLVEVDGYDLNKVENTLGFIIVQRENGDDFWKDKVISLANVRSRWSNGLTAFENALETM